VFVLRNFDRGVNISFNNSLDFIYTVRYATVNGAATNECYNEQFSSIQSGGYNENRRYNESGGILFIMEISMVVFTKERLFMFSMCIRLFILFIRESLFIVFTQ
jgi:hypothetical protein